MGVCARACVCVRACVRVCVRVRVCVALLCSEAAQVGGELVKNVVDDVRQPRDPGLADTHGPSPSASGWEGSGDGGEGDVRR